MPKQNIAKTNRTMVTCKKNGISIAELFAYEVGYFNCGWKQGNRGSSLLQHLTQHAHQLACVVIEVLGDFADEVLAGAFLTDTIQRVIKKLSSFIREAEGTERLMMVLKMLVKIATRKRLNTIERQVLLQEADIFAFLETARNK